MLFPFSAIYLIGYFIKYLSGKNQKFNANFKVICVGSLTSGGAGKTEIAILIANFLSTHGRRVCFLTKGYKRISKEDVFLPKGFGYNSEDYKIYGDEPLLLASHADVFITSNRAKLLSTKKISEYDFVVTDDGLHDSSFFKDIKLAIFDANKLIGNGFTLPSGPLRLPFFLFRFLHKKSLDAVIFTDAKSGSNSKMLKISKQVNCDKIFTSKIKALDDINKSKQYIAFAGIGINSKFFDFLEENGIKITAKIEYSDHHKYQPADVECITNAIKQFGANSALTTLKDFIKIPYAYRDFINPVRIRHEVESEFFDFLQKKL